jgi:hypothetical protein
MPETVGSYRLLRPLGSGGMGSVYEAEDRTSGRRVAVKLVASDHRVSEETLNRFRQEGRLASAIAHPRCVFVLAADEEAGRPYIVMELMPGATLNDLVNRNGPLPVEDAIRKILDVIEGLQEAHRLGVIHRDVKPSNCFVTEDGRVKVGDFGLAKSLSGNVHLTRTGAFLGTPLFASPEQIRNDPVNEQTDVYSVAATLYFLLTGRAPFQGRDATATLARIVADPAPSMQTLRPDIPGALDRAVLKGLERNRERRYANLEEFRRALLPLLAGQFSIAGLGLRLGAYVIDWLVFGMLFASVGVLLEILLQLSRKPRLQAAVGLGDAVILGLYFSTTEWLFGCSLGKWLARLRVRSVRGSEPPGIAQLLLRSFSFLLLVNLASRVQELSMAFNLSLAAMKSPFVILTVVAALWLLGWALLFGPMRPRNGYRGLHEWLSGTRVIRLPNRKPRRVLRARLPDRFEPDLVHPAALPVRIGSFTVRGALCWDPEGGVLAGEDPGLKRPVWIWLRPLSATPLPPARHAVDRGTRPRWLAGGKEAAWQWDAFLAPAAVPLLELVATGGSLTWTEVRPLFEELTDELAAADKEETLPETLAADQVGIQPTGKVLLLDMRVAQGPIPPNSAGNQKEARAFALLHNFAALVLEGKPRTAGDNSPAIRAPLPEHASKLLQRLQDANHPFADLGQLQAALRANGDRPTEVSRFDRFQRLAASSVIHAILLGLAAFAVWLSLGDDMVEEPVFWAGFTALAVAWALATRGGCSLPLSKTALVDAAGRNASRWRCAWRAIVLWAPLVVLSGLAYAMTKVGPPPSLGWVAHWLDWVTPATLLALGALYIGSVFWTPARVFHDRLAGTFVVPR